MSIAPTASALSAATSRTWSKARPSDEGCQGIPPACDRYQPGNAAHGLDTGDLFRRLAQAAKTTARATTVQEIQGIDGQIGDILARTFGLSVAQVNVDHLAGEESHRAAGMVSTRQDAQGTTSSVAAARVDDLHLTAEGTVTTADGQQFHFQLDYLRHQETAMAAQQTTTTAPVDVARPNPLGDALASASPAHRLRRLLAMLPKAQADGAVNATA